MNPEPEKSLILLFKNWAGEKAQIIYRLPGSGSYREYYRIQGNKQTALGVFNPDHKETRAFIEFARHFRLIGLNVPQIYLEDVKNNIYLIEDLGDLTLYSYLVNNYKNGIFPDRLIDVYKKVIAHLPRFQILADKGLNYSFCYPRSKFDKRSMLWDLNYFKYYFLKLAKVSFDEEELENDFQTFSNYLLQADCNYFLYRDFQSRNILLVEGEPYFIDFQGGRKGALQYDIASLLYDAKADIPQHLRDEFLEEYIRQVNQYISIDEKLFRKFYWGYVLIRVMQAMGSYGFRGFYEKKEHFLKSIPYAVANLHFILNNVTLPVEIPALWKALNQIVESSEFPKKLAETPITSSVLKVQINSFAYRNGIPADPSGNGGGFVFDCRGIPNPGRYEKYKSLNGRHPEVIKFLKEETDIDEFLKHIYAIVDKTVSNYIERQFTNLMVSFGCTGGQHRSVYCAEQLARHLRDKFPIQIELNHTALKNISEHSEN
ncbi:MAG TPA: RNase adapter RapZ [Candidatus Marinimicrobia bacterium]|nr:RNase adapter RapZ [Candidatus Neomarinimicrobiota bacterium]HRS51624.1 RNase adapter RapZ [Candidatus Neomarinimicrobiota bacterium]HRU92298.1 RNase adapter RapZ [Candidatus Neomarinimicrobiota bacterium]